MMFLGIGQNLNFIGLQGVASRSGAGSAESRAWLPTDATSATIILWLDPEREITASNGRIREWVDQVAPTQNATQTTESLQPYTGRQINGRDVVDFRGDEALRVALDVDRQSDALPQATFFFMFKGDAAVDSGVGYIFAAGRSIFDRIAVANFSDESERYGTYSGARFTTSPDTNPHVYGWVSHAGNTSTLSYDGVLTTYTENSHTTTQQHFTLGALSSGGGEVDGAVGDFFVFDGLLDEADRQRMEGWLAHRWGLETNLASDHPYRNASPWLGFTVTVDGDSLEWKGAKQTTNTVFTATVSGTTLSWSNA